MELEKFKQLSKLPLSITILSHGNVKPERGFSIKKTLLEIRGTAIEEETLEAVREVKDLLIHSSKLENFTNDKGLIKSCRDTNVVYK